MKKNKFLTTVSLWAVCMMMSTFTACVSENVDNPVVDEHSFGTNATMVTTDEELRSAIVDGASIKLANDIDLSNSTLSIPKGSKVTINLGGFTLDRKLTKRGEGGGQVITVRKGATLILSNGTLAGGWGGNAGGIANETGTVNLVNVTITGCTGDDRGGGISNLGGKLTMKGGAITNNTCNDKGDPTGGAGIYNAEGATALLTGVTISGNQEVAKGGAGICNYGELTLNGCTITENKAITVGGGIWNKGTLKITGKNIITGNVNAAGQSDNLFLRTDETMLTVTGDLTGSQIGIMLDTDRAFTTGYSASNTVEPTEIFTADLPTMTISKKDGEANISAPTDGNIYYIERSWDAENKCVVETVKSLAPGSYTLLTSNNQNRYELTEEFYVVQGTVNVNGLWLKNKDVHIILCNGSKLNFKEGGCIQIRHNNTLYVHDQPNAYNNMGKLVMGADGKADGIGMIYQEDGSPGSAEFHGGDIRISACHDGDPAIGTGPAGQNILGAKFTFYSGNYYLQGGRTAAGLGAGSAGKYCGEITIYGGNIEAIGSPENSQGYSGAGIGGGSLCTDGTINIYGGRVIARGGHEAAGIGASQETGSDNNINVNIYGGYVEARGDKYGAGIGGGDGVRGCNVEIYDGEVYAYGGTDAAGIGGGEGGYGGSINIYGGYVYAKGGDEYGAGIGGGQDGNGAQVQIFGGTIIAEAGSNQTGCRAIGPGHGSETYGSLILADDLMVSSERMAVESERQGMCWYRTKARIEPCTHPGYTADTCPYHKH